jgi:hypothetical protein
MPSTIRHSNVWLCAGAANLLAAITLSAGCATSSVIPAHRFSMQSGSSWRATTPSAIIRAWTTDFRSPHPSLPYPIILFNADSASAECSATTIGPLPDECRLFFWTIQPCLIAPFARFVEREVGILSHGEQLPLALVVVFESPEPPVGSGHLQIEAACVVELVVPVARLREANRCVGEHLGYLLL